MSRLRIVNAGRKSYQEVQPRLEEALDRLIHPTTRGDPMAALRWTCKSTRNLADELTKQGFQVGPTTIRRLLTKLGYSLQGNRKTREGKDHPDRDAQFEHINTRVMARKRRGEPAISADTKKKEISEIKRIQAEHTRQNDDLGKWTPTIFQTRKKVKRSLTAFMIFI